jgi:hypothetical protein
MVIDEYLDAIMKDCEYLLTSEQLQHIRYTMAQYAERVLESEDVEKENDDICFEELDLLGEDDYHAI